MPFEGVLCAGRACVLFRLAGRRGVFAMFDFAAFVLVFRKVTEGDRLRCGVSR